MQSAREQHYGSKINQCIFSAEILMLLLEQVISRLTPSQTASPTSSFIYGAAQIQQETAPFSRKRQFSKT
jgi:hypothetical protein